MAINAAPFALKNLGLDAEPLRQAVASLVPNAGGVTQSGDFPVTQTAVPSLAVLVGVGRAWMPGTDVANYAGQTYSAQGQYFALNDAAVTVPLSTANPTNPRIDRIYIGAVDTFYGGGSDTIKIDKVTGTPAASPVAPAAPPNSITLATVTVAANATSILNASITQAVNFVVGEDIAQQVTPNSLYQNSSGFRTVKVRRVRNRAVMNGAFTNKNTTTWNAGQNYVFGTLPDGFAPPAGQAERFPIAWANTAGGSVTPGWAGIDSTGQITFALSAAITGAAPNLYVMSVSHTWDVI